MTALRSLAPLVLLAGALALPACGGPAAGAGGAPTREIVVTGSDTMRFAPAIVTVAPGEAVTLTFHNQGVIPHDLVTRGAGRDVRLVHVSGGAQQRAVFRANRPGVYEVICTQPGHREAGMVGQVVVQEAAS